MAVNFWLAFYASKIIYLEIKFYNDFKWFEAINLLEKDQCAI